MKRLVPYLIALAAIAVLVLALAACTTQVERRVPLERVELATIDSALMRSCANPVAVPEQQEYVLAQLLRFWESDRSALAECGGRQKSLAEAVRRRDAIQGAIPGAGE